MKKELFFLVLVFLFVSILTSYASIMGNNKSVDVSSSSGSATAIVYDDLGYIPQRIQADTHYDPSKFTVVPSNFRPADYTSIDLFKAVSASRNLQIVLSKLEAIDSQFQSNLMLGLGGSYVLEYKSDLTFVHQNGTDITFSSDDNAITQNMFIDQRSGLQAGQKVCVYYMITRSPLITWDVIAIERR